MASQPENASSKVAGYKAYVSLSSQIVFWLQTFYRFLPVSANG